MYKSTRDLIMVKEKLEEFMNINPELVVNLEIHHDVLFEIGGEPFLRILADSFLRSLLICMG